MNVRNTPLPVVDVHAHYGPYQGGQNTFIDEWMSADAHEVVTRARGAQIDLTIASPLAGLMPRGEADAFAANEEAAKTASEIDGLLQWVIVHPLQPRTYEQAMEMLAQPQCVGIKIHPEEHVYPIREHGAELFEFAARHDAIVLTHSGDPNSWPIDFVPFADAHPNVRLILAHLGNGGGAAGDPTLQVRAIQATKSTNVFVDTSSARSMVPGLVEWAVSELGSQRILFGTDTPVYCTSMQRARIDDADIKDDDKDRILRRNAAELFQLQEARV
jgi:predicted TIM-barrel fold metal-dependent hydrolase